LTVGNHDGYVATGQIPALIDPLGTGLKSAVDKAAPKEWPNFNFDDFKAYLDKSKSNLGGLHLDIFTGQFARRDQAKTFSKGRIQISRPDRNMVLYDGFHQWHKTYGPTYAEFAFGKNVYMNLNTYDLRQHRRSGWGMYTVNYGGGISKVQAEWLE